MISSMKFFQKNEFLCGCGCGKGTFDDMDQELLQKLDLAREIAGIPFVVKFNCGGSGFRCRIHNKNVGGVDDSQHMLGKAVDIRCGDSALRFIILNALIKAGFKRIGIAKTFIHVDVKKSTSCIFLYKSR
ncbi:MAG: peptidase M15 [Desulfamplus sp.]|nr:peptidase M15 [Desulfamplus sp.]